MNSSKTTGMWLTIIVVLLIIIGGVVAYIYMRPSQVPVLLNQNSLGGQTVGQATSTQALSTDELENGTYSLFGDAFTLMGGQAAITGHSFSATSTPLIPVGYTYAVSGSGNLSNSGELSENEGQSTAQNGGQGTEQGSVVAMYRSFGANLEWVALFAVVPSASNNAASNGSTFQEVASGIVYQNDSKIQSVSVENGIVTLNLLVVSTADQSLPHYEQTPTTPITLQFQIENGGFVPVAGGPSTLGKG